MLEDLQKQQVSSVMILTPRDVTTLDFKESIFSRIPRFLPSLLGITTWGGRSWNQRENNIISNVKNSSFGYNLIIEIWMSEGPGPLV